MQFLTLVSAVLIITVQQLVEWRFGVAGLIGLLMLTLGIRANRPGISSAGAVLLALLVSRPAL
ncbi:hypothetical protein HTV45_27025 [Streptomyces sp. CHD11]|uniref:hypothetical protein n=1 Tax=Streptomyces sp. CHD11 TaxID=2741325 RepID=UPI001BFC80B8|nr:hypothetical protein [Streptomyces sp. CHD11]MBT3154479.1 hypothetical protein [Streptomyces sp. CHD11]